MVAVMSYEEFLKAELTDGERLRVLWGAFLQAEQERAAAKEARARRKARWDFVWQTVLAFFALAGGLLTIRQLFFP